MVTTPDPYPNYEFSFFEAGGRLDPEASRAGISPKPAPTSTPGPPGGSKAKKPVAKGSLVKPTGQASPVAPSASARGQAQRTRTLPPAYPTWRHNMQICYFPRLLCLLVSFQRPCRLFGGLIRSHDYWEVLLIGKAYPINNTQYI